MIREDQFIGQSATFLDAVEQASKAALVERPVLIVGERGTGKELVAQRLHRLSNRWDKAFIILNCSALPETLIEAELFGHEAGAFTGATKARAGRFEEADEGTLFLDELGTLSIAAQERLLRATEYGEITRIGSSKPIAVDVRIIGATNSDLPAMARSKKFRADLLDRLSFEVINLPPLRHREEDVMLLAEYFGRRMAIEMGLQDWRGFGLLAQKMLLAHDWPGNVRELRNVVERAVYRWEDKQKPIDEIVFDPFLSLWDTADSGEFTETISDTGDTAAQIQEQKNPAPLKGKNITDFKHAMNAYEHRILSDALDRNQYNQKKTARSLNLTYDQLRHALKRHELR